MDIDEAFKNYKTFLTSLTVDEIKRLSNFVRDDVKFKDPFHDTIGCEAMMAIFQRLFSSVENIEFTVSDHAIQQQTIYFTWQLVGDLSAKPWVVEGVTRLKFDDSGKVAEHVEYWDAATQFYDRLPIIGALLRYLRRRIAGS